MDTCDLINRTADHIEKFPQLYDFDQGVVTHPMKTHCMLSRMGQLAGIQQGVGCSIIAAEILKVDPRYFYADIVRAAGSRRLDAFGHIVDREIVGDPRLVPAALRKVAEKYRGIPVSIQAIFKAPPLPPNYIDRLNRICAHIQELVL